MSKKTIVIIGILAAVLIVLGFTLYGNRKPDEQIVVTNFEQCVKAGNPVMESYPKMCRASDGALYTEKIPVLTEAPILEDKSNLIRVTNPQPNQVIASPITLTGEARGGWFFEGSFSGELLDGNGNRLAVFIAQANGEWMTSEFVPFSSKLEFSKPTTPNGTLVFKKDNASGLPEHDDELRVPVRFAPGANLSLKVYFGNTISDPNVMNCGITYPTVRSVPTTPTPARAAILELLKGVTEAEKEKGFKTLINEDVVLQKINIIEGTAFVDFNQALQEKVGGSCRVMAIRSQIESTLKQFPTVKNVVISINGKTQDILQP